MRIASIALLSSLVPSANAVGFRELVDKITRKHSESTTAETIAAAAVVEGADQENRGLSCSAAAAWHPQYSQGWTEGYCRSTIDCNSPGYSTELACCKAAYAGQIGDKCLKNLPSPPTTSPTDAGGLEVYYPDYNTAWTEAGCINKHPLPSGRPAYSTMIACCKGAYGGQMSGKCLSMLPSPPTTSPTSSDYAAAFWYPDYETVWSEAGCSNTLPLPYNNVDDRPNYKTLFACCKGAYGGQMSGKCLSELDSPPTTSPTAVGGSEFYYPDYDTAWSEAGCVNTLPIPSGRPNYDTQIACCKGAYAGQMSGKCISELATPPTTSPTAAGGSDVYYPDYGTAWSDGTCLNTLPLPFLKGGRPVYDGMLACCKGAYGGQTSGKCLSKLPTPPTTSPTTAGGLEVYYPDYTLAWPEGICINTRPIPSGRPSYTSKTACCSAAYGGQTSSKCMCDDDICYSCDCGTSQERATASCTIECP